MLIRTCLYCKFHEIREHEGSKTVFCSMENCFSQYSKCISKKALEWCLRVESSNDERPPSFLERLYPRE